MKLPTEIIRFAAASAAIACSAQTAEIGAIRTHAASSASDVMEDFIPPDLTDADFLNAMVDGSSTIKMQPYEVPFTSEYDVQDLEWRVRACSPAAVYMALQWALEQDDKASNGPQNIDDFVQKGLELGAHVPSKSWTHEGLAGMATYYGTQAKTIDYGNQADGELMKNILSELMNGPIAVSMGQGKESRNGHFLVLTGFERNGRGQEFFYVNDPIARFEDNSGHGASTGRFSVSGKRTLTKEEFLDKFKRRAIVVRPVNQEA